MNQRPSVLALLQLDDIAPPCRRILAFVVVLDGIGEDIGLTLNIRRVTDRIGIGPYKELGDPQTHPTQWMMIVIAMTIVENGTTNLDYLAMLKGYAMAMEL